MSFCLHLPAPTMANLIGYPVCWQLRAAGSLRGLLAEGHPPETAEGLAVSAVLADLEWISESN
jgi:hypothetical protein